MTKQKQTKFKTALCIILFFALLAALLCYLLRVFGLKDDKHSEWTFNSFYAQTADSLDGIYLGSSAAYRYFMPTEAYRRYGMAIFNMGTGSQPVVLQKYIIKEALKTQPHMKVILIDIRSLVSNDKTLKEADIRRVTDAMHFSETRTQAISAALAYFKSQGADISYNQTYYQYPFLMYHNRWKDDLSPWDLIPVKRRSRYKGFVLTWRSKDKLKKAKQPKYTDATATTLDQNKRAVLEDLLAYCKTLDQKVIFVSSPYMIGTDDQKTLNAYVKLIRAEGFDVLDYNTQAAADSLKLNWSHDFMDRKHTNVYGAKKYTKAVAAYLHKNVKLADHRGDADYESWDTSVQYVKDKLAETPSGKALEQAKKEVETNKE